MGTRKGTYIGLSRVRQYLRREKMKKQVTISGKDYFMKSSAYTQFKYKDDTGRSLLTDLKAISNHDAEDIANNVDDLLEMLLKISYIMIQEADEKQVGTYNEFLKELDGLFDENNWISEVLELAISPLSRGIQTHPQE